VRGRGKTPEAHAWRESHTNVGARALSSAPRSGWQRLCRRYSGSSVLGAHRPRHFLPITDDVDQVQLIGSLSLDRSVVLGISAAGLVIRLLMAVLTSKQSATLSNGVVFQVRRRLVRAYFGAEWSVQHGQQPGSIQEYASSYTNSVIGYLNSASWFVVSLANLIALLGVAIVLDPIGALALAAAIGVLAAALRPLRTAIGRRARRANNARVEFATTVSEYSSLGLDFKIFNVAESAQVRLDELAELSRKKSIRYAFLSSMNSPLFSALAYGALLGVVVMISIVDVGDIAALGAVMLLVLRSLSYGQAIQGALSSLASSRPIVDDLLEKIEELEAAQRGIRDTRIDSVTNIQVRDVSFEYDPGTAVLSDVSFEFRRHEIVGIVGPSGSGKSTLVQLLLSLRHPTSGSILVDGIDIGSIDSESLSRMITFVPQSAGFLSGTIRENIRFLRQDVSDIEVEEAARRAHIYDEIVKMPTGFERSVGENGGNLSGGQQQRLSIARALVESPQLMILDEPTSALDVRSERLLRNTLLGLKEEMALVIIAHRLTTLEICDRIMVIQDGRIMAFDSPDKLAGSSDFFKEALELSGLGDSKEWLRHVQSDAATEVQRHPN